MDELIRKLEVLTTDIVNRLPEASFEELALFVSRREDLVKAIATDPVSAIDRLTYRTKIENILAYDRMILPKMEQLRLEAKQELQKLTVARTQKHGYQEDDGYANSYFFDKRK
jgi:hypothetical protein